MPTKLFVGNISDSCTEDDLKAHFAGHGKVVEHAIIRNYGFVHFEQLEDAEKAMKELNNSSLKGTQIRVEISKTPYKTGAGRERLRYAPPPDRSRGTGRPGYGQGGSGYDREHHYGGHHPPATTRDRYHPYYDRYSREAPSQSYGDRYGYDSRREEYSRGYDYRGYPQDRYSDYYNRQRYGDPVRYPEHNSNRF